MSNEVNSSHNADGKFILVQDGKRLEVKPSASREEAEAEATRQKPIQEAKGSKGPIEVKQNIFG
jgi:hypothetical protein